MIHLTAKKQNQTKMRIFLVGYMGSGKTAFGKKLATFMEVKHIDIDTLIEEQEERSIREIFEEEGEDYFRKLERKKLHSCTAYNNVVISTGGGVPMYFDNMEWMNANGITVYLKTTPKALFSRLVNAKEERPIIQGKTEKSLLGFIENHLGERAPFYERAQLTVDSLNWKKLNLAAFTEILETTYSK